MVYPDHVLHNEVRMTPEELKFFEWQLSKLKEVEEKIASGEISGDQIEEAYENLKRIGVLDEDGNLAKMPEGWPWV